MGGDMESRIWKVKTGEVGKLEPFRTEYDMESFLMNNPQIIGCSDPNVKTAPRLLRQQIQTIKKTDGKGRIDLVGLVPDNEGIALKIFELKKGEITKENVEQLFSYINQDNWLKETSARGSIQSWIQKLEIPELKGKNLEKILNNPKGVIIGSSFKPEAITLLSEKEMAGIRLTRFMSGANEYYVVIEDQVGDILSDATRQLLSWKKIGVRQGDRLFLDVGGKRMWARPDTGTLDRPNKNVILEKASRGLILRKENVIRSRVKDEFQRKSCEIALRNLKDSKPISLTGATCIGFLMLKGEAGSFFVPANYWRLERTGEKISQLESGIRKGN
jgi:hypothetical protein